MYTPEVPMLDPDATFLAEPWSLAARSFLHDAARCLALAHQGQLRLDARGQLAAGAIDRLVDELILKPRAPNPQRQAQWPGLSFTLDLLGQAGYLAAGDSLLLLAPAVHDWLGLPASIQLDRIRQVWWLAPLVNTRWLPVNRRQRPLDSHWRSLILHTCRWAVALPADEWTPAEGLAHHLSEQGAIQATGAGANLPRVRRALRRQSLALADFLLQVALPRLGLIELRPGDDGLHLRPTPGGAEWLHAALERADLLAHPPQDASVEMIVPAGGPVFPSAESSAVIIDLDLRITIPLSAPILCTFELCHVAQLLTPGPPARYRITKESLRQGVAWGYPVADVLFMLDRFSGEGLPSAVVTQLERWRTEMKAMACEPGYRLRTEAPPLLDALRQCEPFRRRTAPLANDQDAWVSRTEAPGLFRYLRRLGYDLALPQDPNDWPLQPRLHQPLPLSQLLVLLRTYRQLRRLVPGLAVLDSRGMPTDLQELEQSLAASLSPGDMAAVERLVESHVTFLQHHLRRGRSDPEKEKVESPDRAGEGASGSPRSSLQDLEASLQSAIEAGVGLDITYADTQGQVTRRRIRPLHLETRWKRRYLLAYCQLRQDERHFRLDRIVDVEEAGDRE